MIIRVLGYPNALALFDYFNGQGVTWSEPTNKKSAWHTLRVNIKPENYFATKFDCLQVFPNARLSFK